MDWTAVTVTEPVWGAVGGGEDQGGTIPGQPLIIK